MNSIFFNFHGVQVNVVARDSTAESILSDLAEDMRFFLTDKCSHKEIEIRLHSKAALPARQSRRLFRARMCVVNQADGIRRCDYQDGTETLNFLENSIRVIEVFSAQRDELHEVAYYALLSLVGESLDRRQYHRVHALGFAMRDRTALLILPQGAGKSAIATLMGDKIRLFSDEIPLVRGNRIYPFPIRIALRPDVAEALNLNTQTARLFRHKKFPAKLVFPIPQAQVAPSRELDFILIGRKILGSTPRIYATSRWLAFRALFESMVVGIGVPQMAEHFLRVDAGLGMIFLSRLRTAIKIARQSSAFVFEVGPDARENARVLEEFLSAGEKK